MCIRDRVLRVSICDMFSLLWVVVDEGSIASVSSRADAVGGHSQSARARGRCALLLRIPQAGSTFRRLRRGRDCSVRLADHRLSCWPPQDYRRTNPPRVAGIRGRGRSHIRYRADVRRGQTCAWRGSPLWRQSRSSCLLAIACHCPSRLKCTAQWRRHHHSAAIICGRHRCMSSAASPASRAPM